MTDDDFEDDDFTPWTDERAAGLREAGQSLIAAVARHTEAVLTADGDMTTVFRSSDELLPALLAFADAQFEYTGNAYPLGALFELVDDEDDEDDEDDGESDPWPTGGISVLQRRDFVITDPGAMMSAGRSAYLTVWPDDSAQDAERAVSNVGAAFHEITHAAGGWDALDDVDGLEPVAAVTAVVEQESMLGPDPDGWGDVLAVEDAEVLYVASDVLRPQ